MAENQEGAKAAPPQTRPVLPAQTNGNGDGTYYIRKNSNYRISCSKVKDEVEGRFIINFNKPLPQFNTAFGKAYDVSEKSGDNQNLYAVILEKKHPVRLFEINKLLEHNIPNFIPIVAAQVVPTSTLKGRSFAVIMKKPEGITLSEYMKRNGPVSEIYIAKTLVPILNDILVSFNQLGVTHGKINAGNIYIDDNGNVTLGECISEPCGYSQPILYETIGRATAMPIAKGNGSHLVDSYALGVLVAVLIRGAAPMEGRTNEEILTRKFEDGTYRLVTDKIEIPTRMFDLLRGLLNERKLEVWSSAQISEWIKGRRFNLLPPPDGAEAGRSMTFNGEKYSNRKHLAHGLYTHWDEARKFIKTDFIIKWIAKNSQDDALVERLEIITGRVSREKDTTLHKDDETLSQYILLLDPTGPIRLKDFSANIDGIGTILSEGIANNIKHVIETVDNIISHSILSIVAGNDNVTMPGRVHETMVTLQKCTEILRKREPGFDIERCLYELNPTLPCQSLSVVDELIFTPDELLLCLDKNESVGGKILDKHMTSFLSERMELTLRIYISSLSRFPEFASNPYIQTLALLSLAQQTGNVGDLSKLCGKVYESLKNVVSEFHSKTIRNDITENLQKAVKRGIIPNMLRIITESKYLVRDQLGFKKSLNTYKRNAIQIVRLSNTRAVNNVGYRYGLQLAVMFSFFMATVEIITLLIKVL